MQLLSAILLVIAISGCRQIAGDSNFTLAKDDAVSGTLLVFSQNVTLEEGSAVDGSVIRLCCNLIIDGKVNENVFLLTGNLRVDANADVSGDVRVFSGNLSL